MLVEFFSIFHYIFELNIINIRLSKSCVNPYHYETAEIWPGIIIMSLSLKPKLFKSLSKEKT
jgi:hypothetical protein